MLNGKSTLLTFGGWAGFGYLAKAAMPFDDLACRRRLLYLLILEVS